MGDLAVFRAAYCTHMAAAVCTLEHASGVRVEVLAIRAGSVIVDARVTVIVPHGPVGDDHVEKIKDMARRTAAPHLTSAGPNATRSSSL